MLRSRVLGCLGGLLLASAAQAQAPGPIVSTPLPGCVSPYNPSAGGPPVTSPGGVMTPPATGGPPLSPGASPGSPLLDGGVMAGAAAGGSVAGGGGEGGSGSLASAAPNMIGDLGSRGSYLERGNTFGRGSGSPIVGQAAFRIVENESARPVDRVFFAYNYFNDIGLAGNNTYDLHRAVIGFEKTLFSGRASFGARVPVQLRDGGTGNSVDGFGDLTLLAKYVLLGDPAKGNVLSAGVAATIPIGRAQPLQGGGNLDSTLVQPWAGFVVVSDRVIVQGFSALVLPTKSIDSRLWANDLGIGYRLYTNADSCATLTAVVPALEAHLLTPLSNIGVGRVQGGQSQVGTPDMLVLTAGVHLGLWNRAWLTFGAATPVTGTRLFNYEGTVMLNVLF